MDVMVSQRDDTAIIEVNGRIDTESAEYLDAALNGALARGAKRVLLNLKEAAYIGSSGIRVLLGGLKNLRRREGDMVLCSVPPDVYGVFLIAGLHEVFPIYPSLDEVFAHEKDGMAGGSAEDAPGHCQNEG
jgi:anti-anti-sigma factor